MTTTLIPKYCTMCGHKLKEEFPILRYDAFTGEPIYGSLALMCVNNICLSYMWEVK